jgi:preprotein translocase subunit SecF
MSLLKNIKSLFSNSKIDFMKVHKVSFFISAFLIISSISLALTKGLNLGIDFSGGILIEVRVDQDIKISKLREILNLKENDVQIQSVNQDSENKNNDFLIRIGKSGKNQSDLVSKVQEKLNQNIANIEYRKIDYVGPQIGSELVIKGFIALLLSLVFLMIYISMRFDWQFGIGAILALFHDAILTLGFFSITGLEFNISSIAAILTIVGYSINDSVVIFDRIRENLRKFKNMNLLNVVNSSINSTLSRTILTSGFTLFSLLALMIYGGDVLFSFSAATFFGIVIGTYSSIYISSPIIIYFDPRKKEAEKK